ncbi:efflux RND transporter periplasmic adaptor subunit [Oceaniovalibus sp. ACAM 378]|uniref:efflux RND transporter periplasmic adaptor subunit n=1 Tax=Oceaniovalibus sp. ACAM 378 TaxID=2599923 RepID=UPI0011D672F5|nr:efflux RND transporter periplasmic adaptor subunit [Oceaniovalibus sp. ACAM 378]TYB87900.1 efflux RND transporter periplasmic adaptor subunit [Oceaniovalibus sp. ACAM 378]
MKAGFKLLFITLPVAAIGAGALAFVVLTSAPPTQTPLTERATTVRVISARERAITPEITGFGLVSPARTFEAIAQVSGTADYVNPDLRKGAILPAGAIILRLSPVDFNLAIAQAKANIRAAEARLAELAVSQANQSAALSIETEALQLKQGDLARVETLFSGGTVSQSALDTVRSGVLAQRQKVLSIQSTLALVPTQREVQQEQIAVYRASLETASLNLARTELKLPFAARVATTSVETGQYVRAGQTAAVLNGVRMAEVEAQVSLAAMRDLMHFNNPDASLFSGDPTLIKEVLRQLGLVAEVRLSLGQDTLIWDARVDRISDTIDPQAGTLGVIVQVESAYSGAEPGTRPPLTKGMFVEVALTAAPVRGMVIPRSALHNGEVLVVDADNRLATVPVTPYLVQDARVLIAEGLTEGQQVIVSDLSPVIQGMLLTAILDDALMADLAK